MEKTLKVSSFIYPKALNPHVIDFFDPSTNYAIRYHEYWSNVRQNEDTLKSEMREIKQDLHSRHPGFEGFTTKRKLSCIPLDLYKRWRNNKLHRLHHEYTDEEKDEQLQQMLKFGYFRAKL
jgi:hypothetical protein